MHHLRRLVPLLSCLSSLSGTEDNGQHPLLNFFSVPYVIRFRQCIGEYCCTGRKLHLLNALKYFTSFPVIYMSFLLTGHSSLNPSWILALSLNFALSCYWDIMIDWELGHRRNVSNPGLRPQISFKPIIYYFAMLVNICIRGIWIFKIVFVVTGKQQHVNFLDSDLGVFLLQMLELARRFVWLLIRCEVELLNSASKSPTIPSSYTTLINES